MFLNTVEYIMATTVYMIFNHNKKIYILRLHANYMEHVSAWACAYIWPVLLSGGVDGQAVCELPPAHLPRHPRHREDDSHGEQLRLHGDPQGPTHTRFSARALVYGEQTRPLGTVTSQCRGIVRFTSCCFLLLFSFNKSN